MENRSDVVRGLSIANVVLGVYLIVSPFLFFEFTAGELWNSVILGIIVAVLALIRLGMPAQRWASSLNGVAGLWLIISPFIVGFASASAYWNTIILGILIAIIGFSNAGVGAGLGRSSHRTHQTPA